jgi:glycosyltransferase involved in cell wall biosynthesis
MGPVLDVPPTGAIDWPSISVVVPSYQQGAFLEETIRSVLLQGYPNLELLLMDGGSSDETIEIIRRYEKWIAAWVSERDGGQSAAINKGWRRSRGELLTWLNSDDLLRPGWAQATAQAMLDAADVDLVYCDVQVIDGESLPLWLFSGVPVSIERFVIYWKGAFAQQGFLMRRRVLDACGPVDEQLHFAMDAEYWLRLLMSGRRFLHVGETLAAFRLHESAKTATRHSVQMADMIGIITKFRETAPPEMANLAERARKRLHWNAAHTAYNAGVYPDARRHALQHLADEEWREALPRVTGMVGLSLLGDRGRKLLQLYRRFRRRKV